MSSVLSAAGCDSKLSRGARCQLPELLPEQKKKKKKKEQFTAERGFG